MLFILKKILKKCIFIIVGELKEKYAEDEGALFAMADYYASQCNYEEAIRYYEKSYALGEKPRFYDPLHGIALIYEIQGKPKYNLANFQLCEFVVSPWDV